MTSGYILIVAILVLGGAIATLGDRIGTKVGKARLSLFNLRPRNTATVVTIITGSLISVSTLGMLLAASGSLRDGFFELDKIKEKLRKARSDVQVVNAQKNQVENALSKARSEQTEAQNRLDVTNQNFQQATTQLKKISQQASILRSEIQSLLNERERLLNQRKQLNEQITQLKTQVDQLKDFVAQRDQELAKRAQTIKQRNQELAQQDQAIAKLDQKTAERDRIINQRDQLIAERDQVIAQREGRLQELQQQLKDAIAQRETRLKALEQELTQQESQIVARDKQIKEGEKQLAYLEQEVETLEQYLRNYQALRQGNVVLLRGQVLASGVVRIVDPSAATEAVEQLLREANRTAIKMTRSRNSNSTEALVQIPQSQVEQLIKQIKDGKDYVVRILSAGNYVEGEKQVQVFADAALNQVIFQAGEVLATISTDTSTMSNEQVRQRLDQLLSTAQFRARRAGILGVVQVGDGRITTIISFIEQLERYNQAVDITAITQETAYTAGPLKMQLVVTQNGQIIFKT